MSLLKSFSALRNTALQIQLMTQIQLVYKTIIEELCMLCITVYRYYEQDRHELAPDVAHRPMVGEGYK